MAKTSTQSPINDLTYDVITVLQNKAKALEAYDKYLSDADAEDDDELKEVFTEMRRQDEEHVLVLKEALARRLDDDLGYGDEAEEEDEEEDYDEEDEVEEPSKGGSDGDDATASAGSRPTSGRPSPAR